ncbi:MAG: TIGR01777 family oxidoreductase [Pirellulales bacterium]
MIASKLIIAGGSGFLGQLVARWFAPLGWDVVSLTRDAGSSVSPARRVTWDGRSLAGWVEELDGADALLNLAGRSVNCRYHARNRQTILHSRLESTRVLGEAVASCRRPPKVWLNSSTATIYKHTLDRAMDEFNGVIAGTPEAKDQFSVEVAQAWERVFEEAPAPQTRKITMRTAMVFGTHEGTVYRVLRRLTRLGLGGPIGGGRQYVSWLHETDFCRAVQWLIEHQGISGVVNLASPNPVTNRDMMRTFRGACHMPVGLPASRWMLEIGMFLLRSESELVIKSRRVVPTRLVDAGFEFQFPQMKLAVDDLESRLATGRGLAKNWHLDGGESPRPENAMTAGTALDSAGGAD